MIKKLTVRDYTHFTDIVANAYPGIGIVSGPHKQKFRERFIEGTGRDPGAHFYGYFRDRKLLAGMCLYDFVMNMFSTKVKVGGVGLIAVDLVHKQEKICKEMVEYFLKHYKRDGYCMAALYPFRPDFYRKMGFGYGTKINQYRIKPANLPNRGEKRHIQFLDVKDRKNLLACYNRYARSRHGLFARSLFYQERSLNNPNVKVVVYKTGGNIRGYLIFTFKPARDDNYLLNDIHIEEYVADDREVFSGLMTFLHSQADQVNEIIFNTQEEFVHFLPCDPRNGRNNIAIGLYHETNTQGVGIMYRVIDTEGLFNILRRRDFNGQNCRLSLCLKDSFLKENDRTTLIHFKSGRPHVARSGGTDVEIGVDVADFSSLIMGAVDFGSLYYFGRAEISDYRRVGMVDAIFKTGEKPVCLTRF